jgi:hypothetical protein
LGCQKHHHRQRAGKDHVLSGIQKRKRGRNLDRSFLVSLEGIVELLDFVLFIVEVL